MPFPTNIDDNTSLPVGGTGLVAGSPSKALYAQRTAIIALETKVGIDASGVLASLDYRSYHRPYHANFYTAGNLVVKTGTLRWYNDSGSTLTFTGVRISVGTVATGIVATPVTNAAIVADVKLDGATIFTSGNSANRPNLAASAFTGLFTTFAVATIATGHYLTADIIYVGSTTPGAELGLQVWMVG